MEHVKRLEAKNRQKKLKQANNNEKNQGPSPSKAKLSAVMQSIRAREEEIKQAAVKDIMNVMDASPPSILTAPRMNVQRKREDMEVARRIAWTACGKHEMKSLETTLP